MPESSETIEAAAAANITVTTTAQDSSTIDVGWTLHHVGRAHWVSITRKDIQGNPLHTVLDHASLDSHHTPNPWADSGLDCTDAYKYTVEVYHGQHDTRAIRPPGSADSPWSQTLSCQTGFSTFALVIGQDVPSPSTGSNISATSQDIPEGKAGTFALLVPRDASILEYIHDKGTITQEQGHLARTLGLPQNDVVQDNALSLIQSSSGKLGAIARVGPAKSGGDDFLVAYEFNSLQTGWTGPVQVVTDKSPIDHVSGSQALIESNHETFELLVPREASIDHYTHEFVSITDGPWKLVATLPPPSQDKRVQVTAISLVEDTSGNLEAIVRVTPPPGGGPDFLVAYEFNSQSGWKGPVNLVADNGPIDKVTGSQAFIRTFIRANAIELPVLASSFELLVPRGGLIDHYTHEKGSILAGPWTFVATLKPPKGDAKIQASAVTLTLNTLGKLDLIAREKPPTGDDFLVAYEFDPVTGWQGPVDLVADGISILAGAKQGNDGNSDDGQKTPNVS